MDSVEAIWLYDIEFINEIEENHYKNLNKAAIKEKYLSGYKQEIKNNIETTYEEFCTWYPDLTDECVKVRNLIDEYISKIEAATDCETVDSLYNEYQEKFYDFINNLYQ